MYAGAREYSIALHVSSLGLISGTHMISQSPPGVMSIVVVW